MHLSIGAARLRGCTSPHGAVGGQILIAVCDIGAGIDPKHKQISSHSGGLTEPSVAAPVWVWPSASE
jgi:hypothetical protein